MLDAARPESAGFESTGIRPCAVSRGRASSRRRRSALTPLRTALRLAVISRPSAWVPAALVYIGGLTVNSQAGMNWSTWTGLAFITMPMGLIVFGVNDIADRTSDAVNSRKGGAWGAVVNARENGLIIWAAVVFSLSFLLLDLLSRHYLAALSVAGICLFACVYSLNPVRLKSRPIADSLSNGFWVICMFCSGYYSSTAGLASYYPAVHILIVLLLCGAAVHALTTLLDCEVDKAAGDQTIGVFLGRRQTLAIAAIMFAVCFFLVSSPVMAAYLGAAATLALIGILRPARTNVQWLVIAILLMLPPSLVMFDIVANIR